MVDDDLLKSQRSFAIRGAVVGGCVGVIADWRIITGSIDPKVADHSPLFPAAVVMMIAFALVVFVVCVAVGVIVGRCIKRPP